MFRRQRCVILSLVTGAEVFRHRVKRERRSMRDYLNRISQATEQAGYSA